MASIEDFIDEWYNDNPYIVAHTSGSTGTPKSIHLLKSDMRVSARATNMFFGINSESVLGLPLSVDYIAGKMMVVRSLQANCHIVQYPVSNTIKINQSIDLLSVVPSQLEYLIKHPEYSRHIKNLLIGGAPTPLEKLHTLRNLGYKAWVSYGMTETCSHVALAAEDDDWKVFRAMPAVQFKCDHDGRLEIISNDFSFKTLKTNDVVDLISPTSFVWRGRADGVINSGGIKMYPEELELIYSRFLTGYSFYVSSLADEKWGQGIALVVEGPDIDVDAIMLKLRASIVDHTKVPRQIIKVDKLSKTSNGKIRRIPTDELLNHHCC